MTSRAQRVAGWRRPLAVAGIALLLLGNYALAQNLGASPQTNVAVQGQTGAQPEGAFLNFINWIGNVIAPVGAGGAVVGAIVSWLTGRGYGRWLFAAAASACGVGRDAFDRVLDHERHERHSLARGYVPSNVNPGGQPWTGPGYPVFGRLPPTQRT